MPSYSLVPEDLPIPVRLSWDVVDLLRQGDDAGAVAILAAQRRVSVVESRRLVAAWRRQRRQAAIAQTPVDEE